MSSPPSESELRVVMIFVAKTTCVEMVIVVRDEFSETCQTCNCEVGRVMKTWILGCKARPLCLFNCFTESRSLVSADLHFPFLIRSFAYCRSTFAGSQYDKGNPPIDTREFGEKILFLGCTRRL